MRSRDTLSLLLCGLWVFLLLSGCAHRTYVQYPPAAGQAATKEFETRTIDEPFDLVFACALEGLLDLQYSIIHSDKISGVLVGLKTQSVTVKDNAASDRNFSRQLDMITAKNETDAVKSWIAMEPEYKSVPANINLTLYIKALDDSTTKVRISKSSRLAEDIAKIWLYIERETLMEADPDSHPK